MLRIFTMWAEFMIAENSPAIYGWENRNPVFKSRQGRQNISFVPDGTGELPNREPSHEWLGNFHFSAPAEAI